jgi:hypothetical protein
MNYAALKTELLTDPAAMGYAVHITNGSDHLLAQLLNAPKVGVSVPVGFIPSEQVVAALDGSELNALTSAQKDTLRVYFTPATVDARPGSAPRTYLLALFGVGTATRAALVAMVDRLGSRAEELGFEQVTADDVSIALRATP